MLGIQTRRWVQSLLLLVMGLYFLDNLLSGRIYFYINERFGWLSWLATGLFLILGIVGVWELLREGRATARNAVHDHEEHHHESDDHDHLTHDHHEHGHEGHNHGAAVSWPVLSVLAVPLVLGLLIPAQPLGASAIGTSGVSTSFSGSTGSTTQLAVAPSERNVLDWVRAFNNSANVDEFTGQPADFIGFVYRDIRFKDKPLFMVARFTISCCVADASAIGVIIQSDDAAKFPSDSWLHVKGKFQTQTLDGQKTPILIADSIEPTDQPAHPYLYP